MPNQNYQRNHQTLQNVDLALLIKPYIKNKNVSCETIQLVVEKYFEESINVSLEKPYLKICGGLINLQVVETKNAKVMKFHRWRGVDNIPKKKLVKDRELMWDNMVKADGRHWEMKMSSAYPFYEFEIDEYTKQKVTNRGRSGGKYLSEEIKWT